MVDGRHTTPTEWSVDDIRAVCARGTGVGADGLVFVGPGAEPDVVRMIYFNSDGSRAAMCGNAALCSTCLAVRLGLANPQHMTLETDAATYESRCTPDGERAELHLAPVHTPLPVPGLAIAPGERQLALGTVGVPHLVVVVDDVELVDVVNRGRLLRSDPALGPAGANVNFISPAARASEWRMRTYERGVEDETLACGRRRSRGLRACRLGPGQAPITFWSRKRQAARDPRAKDRSGLYDDVWLGGEARLVVRGVIN